MKIGISEDLNNMINSMSTLFSPSQHLEKKELSKVFMTRQEQHRR